MNKTNKRVVFWCIAFSVIFSISCALSFLLLFNKLKGIHYFISRDVVPGTFEISIPQPGDYQIWYEYDSIVGDKTYATGKKFPDGMICSLREKTTGESTSLTPPSVSASYSIGSRQAVNLWNIRLERPGLYAFEGVYEPGKEGQDIVITVTPSLLEFTGRVFKKIFFPLLLISLVFILALAVIIIVFLRLLRPQTLPAQANAPAAISTLPTEPQPRHKSTGAFCHLGALACWFGIPFGNIIAPLIIWLLTRNESGFVDAQGKESLNFEISLTLYFFFSCFLIFILLGILLLIILPIAQVILVIVAAVQASEGRSFRYPFTIRFIT